MGKNPIDYRLPGSFILDVLSSPKFQKAVDAGVQELIRTGDLQMGLDTFNERAVKNGLAVHALFAIILELAQLIIKWYFEQNVRGKLNA